MTGIINLEPTCRFSLVNCNHSFDVQSNKFDKAIFEFDIALMIMLVELVLMLIKTFSLGGYWGLVNITSSFTVMAMFPLLAPREE